MQFIIFLLVFSVIVTIHEFGHYYFAKKAGVLVREFAIGMGPKLFSSRKNGTTFTLRMLPLGGYVRLAGRGDDVEPLKAGQQISIVCDEKNIVQTINTSNKVMAKAVPFEVHEVDLEKAMILTGRLAGQENVISLAVSKEATLIEANGTEIQVAPFEKQFEQIKPWQKMLVNVAGPMNNFILGIVLFASLAFITGGVNSQTNSISVVENSPASMVGLQTGDKIKQVNGVNTTSWSELLNELAKARANESTKAVSLEIEKMDGKTQTVDVFFKDNKIGITQARQTDIMSKLAYGFTESWRIATSIFTTLAQMFTKGFDIQQIGGPVAIAQATGQVAEQGLIAIIWFTAMLSVNLGVMNLLPIPVLDGGKIILNIVEWVRGKPVSPQKEMIVTAIGAGIMVLLFLAVTFNDIMRLFR